MPPVQKATFMNRSKRELFDLDRTQRQKVEEHDVRHSAHRFLEAHVFIERLRKYNKALTMQEYRDIRQMALDGNIDMAQEKLDIILREKSW